MSWSYWFKNWQYDPVRPLFTVEEARWMIASGGIRNLDQWARDAIVHIVKQADANGR